jgi:NAD(P)H dehydrogenase (quinone)
MKALLVYWHPEPKSFNHAMLVAASEALAASGAELQTSDLHAMAFDPVSDRRNFTTVRDSNFLKLQLEEKHATEVGGFSADIETEQQKLEWCDLMVWQFPLWWFGLPAVFKGWVDRVFAMGRVYGGDRVYEGGVFRGKRALVSLTTGGPEEAYLPGGFNGDINGILKPIHRGMLQFVGFDVLAPHIVYGPAHLTHEQRQAEILRFQKRLAHISTEQPITVGHY